MAQVTIHVPPRPYQARIENGLLSRAGALLAELLPQSSKVFVVTAPPVRRRWGAKLLRSLTSAGFKPQVLQIPDGEPAKKLATIETMAERLVSPGRRPQSGSDRAGRRRGRRCHRIALLPLHAWCGPGSDSDHRPGPGGCLGWRQDCREPWGREESARNLSPSAGGSH
jgi:hypothetical protein